jgi:NifB/MoaA-like Fe-S oxidoreductase
VLKKFIINGVENNSILDEMEVEAGDILLSINGMAVTDILDYRYLIADDTLVVEIKKPDGEIWELDIEKEYEEDLGVTFPEEMIGTKTCKNNCIFCFIDQLPSGMRDSLYVKDDDERLSFLTGNYITMTNLTPDELNRIIRYRIMPMNLSIHTTNPNLRIKMLKNRFAGDVMSYLTTFYDNGIAMNGQIVLVPDFNDGIELEKTLHDLKALYPVHDEMEKKYNNGFVYPGDEFFLLAQSPIPESIYYSGFPQIENGVGMMADFKASVKEALQSINVRKTDSLLKITAIKIGILTGTAAYDYLGNLVDAIKTELPSLDLTVFPIINHFFGEAITVSGLLTGSDILTQMKPRLDKNPCDLLLLPENALRSGTSTLLDDWTLETLGEALNVTIHSIPVQGEDLLQALLDK